MSMQNVPEQNKNVLYVKKLQRKYKFVVRSVWGQYAAESDGSSISKQYVVLKIKDIETESEIIHPITDFVLSNWKHRSFNTMKASAFTVAMFMNFLLENKNYYNLDNISQLDFEHGTAFLNELTYKKTPKQTVKKHESVLISFFKYLVEKEIIDENKCEFKEKTASIHSSVEIIMKSPFKVEYFNNSTSYSIHQLPDEYILRFLEVAYQLNSCIALGIYMQFFGGVRTGEVCNLRVKDLQLLGSYGENGFILNLNQDRHLRDDLNNTAGSDYIKSKRWQIVLGFKNWSRLFFEKHMSSHLPKHVSGGSPLFINRDGLGLTGSSYYYHFNKVKAEFLKTLRESTIAKDRLNAITLEASKWSSHLGRGVFSNLLAEEADNLYDVSIPRGDKSFNSVKPYLANTGRIKKKIENKISEIYKNDQPFLE